MLKLLGNEEGAELCQILKVNVIKKVKAGDKLVFDSASRMSRNSEKRLWTIWRFI